MCRIDLSGRYWYLDAETCELKTIYTISKTKPFLHLERLLLHWTSSGFGEFSDG